MTTRQFTELPPLSLYVHLPWCVRKCPYCDFNSHEQRTDIPEEAYIDALLRDLEQEMPDVWGRSLTSIFIGGGTPSLFSAEQIDKLLSGIRALTGVAPSVEITMEANPGTFEQEKFKDFFAAGINRLSIGIQSFNDEALSALGRIHTGGEATRAVEIARNAGFENINLDLMFGLPGQTLENAKEDVAQAIALAPEHISYYELTLEPNTMFAKYPPMLPEADACESIQSAGMALLEEAGFKRYEISAFAQPKSQSQHNLNYWLFGDYIGIGAGAHGKISFANTGDIVRRSKVKHPARYLETATTPERIGSSGTISLEDTAIEFMMNALRLCDGFPIPHYLLQTGVGLDRWQGAIEAAQQAGLLEQSGLNIRASAQGLRFLNDLLGHFMTSGEDEPTPVTRNYPVIPLVSRGTR